MCASPWVAEWPISMGHRPGSPCVTYGKTFHLMRRIAEQGSRRRSSSALFSPLPRSFIITSKSTFKWSDSQFRLTRLTHCMKSSINYSRSISICPLLKVGRSWIFWETLHRSVWGWLTVRLAIGAGFTTDVCTQLDWVIAGILRYRFDLLAPIYIKLEPILLFSWVSFWSQLGFMWMRTSLWFRSRLYVLGLEWTFDFLSRRASMISENTNAVLPKDPNTLCPIWHYHLTARYL